MFLCSGLLDSASSHGSRTGGVSEIRRLERRISQAVASALHTMNHSVYVNWNYQS